MIGHNTGVTFTGRSGRVGVALLESGGQGRRDLAISPKGDGGAEPLPNINLETFEANNDDNFFSLGVVQEEFFDFDETESFQDAISDQIVEM